MHAPINKNINIGVFHPTVSYSIPIIILKHIDAIDNTVSPCPDTISKFICFTFN